MHPLDVLLHIGLALMGGFFVWGGLNHFRIFGDMRAMLAGRGWPAPGVLLTLGSLWEAGWGLVLLSGRMTGWAAAALILFVLTASVTLLDFWNQDGEERQTALNAFLLNLALIGGLMLAAAAR